MAPQRHIDRAAAPESKSLGNEGQLFGQPEAVVTTDVQSEGAILEYTLVRLNTHAR